MDFSDLKILCIDDEEQDLKTVYYQLKIIGNYDVDTTTSAKKALDMLKMKEYSVIITDQNLKFNKERLQGTDIIRTAIYNGYKGHTVILTKEDILELDKELQDLREAGTTIISKEGGTIVPLSAAIHQIMCIETKRTTGEYILTANPIQQAIKAP